MNPSNELRLQAEYYIRELAELDSDITLGDCLGFGQDGAVWKTTRPSAIKAFDTALVFQRELQCYQRLRDLGISQIDEFHIPSLIAFDQRLKIIEMEIVEAPYILDFGKTWLVPPPYSKEQLQEWRQQHRELWGKKSWTLVSRLLRKLEANGIYYMDPNPRNIGIPGWQDEDL